MTKTVKYHINNDNEVGICTAEPGNCRFGGDNSHYNTQEEADRANQKRLLDKYGNIPYGKEGSPKPSLKDKSSIEAAAKSALMLSAAKKGEQTDRKVEDNRLPIHPLPELTNIIDNDSENPEDWDLVHIKARLENSDNLKEQTLYKLAINGKSIEDVEWIGNEEYQIPVDSYWEQSDFTYYSGYGGTKVPTDLKVVGDDFWLERGGYDGSEWWEYKELPIKPRDTRVLLDLQRENTYTLDGVVEPDDKYEELDDYWK